MADGFRNAYDFAFDGSGDIFVYDSDGERDVSLPWYRPTRVFHALPAHGAGWLSRSWKRPGYFLDMPPVVGSFGRGSPTGLACYRHRQFPVLFRGAIFACDRPRPLRICSDRHCRRPRGGVVRGGWWARDSRQRLPDHSPGHDSPFDGSSRDADESLPENASTALELVSIEVVADGTQAGCRGNPQRDR